MPFNSVCVMHRLAYAGQLWLSAIEVCVIVGKVNMMFALDFIVELDICCGATTAVEFMSLCGE